MKKEELSSSILKYNQGGDFDIYKISATLINTNDIIVYELQRKNEQKLLCMALKTSTKIDSWFWLIPTENQIKSILDYSFKLLNYYNKTNGKDDTSIFQT